MNIIVNYSMVKSAVCFKIIKDAVLIFFEVDDQKSETDESRIEPNHQSASFDNSLSHYPLSLLVLY